MIISKAQVQNILKVYAKDFKMNKAETAKGSTGVLKKDEITLSDASKLKQKAMQAVKQTDDVRMDRVTDLQERISSGTYTLSDNEVAEKIIERAIVDKLV